MKCQIEEELAKEKCKEMIKEVGKTLEVHYVHKCLVKRMFTEESSLKRKKINGRREKRREGKWKREKRRGRRVRENNR